MLSRALVPVARFALIYGVFVALCALLPVYAWIEAAGTRVADTALRQRAMQERALRLERRGDAWLTVYELRVGELERRLERPYHKHAFLLVLYLALVLATPELRRRDRVLALGVGGAAVFALCVAMLMSDVELWERDALAQAGLAGATAGPYALPLGFVRGLHRTAAAGLLPVILWVFFTTARARARA